MNDLARRFLHVNLNCVSLDATERFYGDGLGMRARMRTDPTVATDGTILGLSGETWCTTSFLYDSRGGRGACALEVIEFEDPPLAADPSRDPVRPGIRGVEFAVPDLDAALRNLRVAGIATSAPIIGLSGRPAALIAGPDGTVVELTEKVTAESTGAVFSGIRIAAIDSTATRDFLCAIGFDEVEPPRRMPVAEAQLAPGGDTDEVACVVGRYALPEDADRFTLTVVAHPETVDEPVPWGGNRQGLYRCALRVEDLTRALEHTPDVVERRGDPVWCPLPGTKIEGLNIAFLRSPDGVVFEFVERPLRFFG